MTTVQLRPTFSILSELPPLEAMTKVRAVVVGNRDLTGQFKNNHAMVSIVESKRRFWSPWLTLEFRPCESGSEIFGRFSPHPGIWTGFMFAYLALAILFFFTAVYGLSQQLAAQTPSGFLLLPIWLAIAIVLWFASKAGQKLARTEMDSIREIVEQCLDTVPR